MSYIRCNYESFYYQYFLGGNSDCTFSTWTFNIRIDALDPYTRQCVDGWISPQLMASAR